jgi:hypothetical protein
MTAKKTDKRALDTHGETVPEGVSGAENTETWLGKQAAAALTGIDIRRLHYLGESQQVRRRKTPLGSWEYAATDLEAFQQPENAQSALTAELIKESNEHARESFKLAFGPAKELFTLLRDENVSLRQQNAKMLDTHLELVKAREELLSEARERELAGQEVQAAIQRKTDMVDMAKRIMPVIAKKLITGNSEPEPAPPNPQVAATLEFLSKVDPSKIQAMLDNDNDFLSEEEKTLLRIALFGPADGSGFAAHG